MYLNGTISTNFKRGQFILINVTVKNTVSSIHKIMIVVQVKDPNGVPIFIGIGKVKIHGGKKMEVDLGFVLPERASTGEYDIKVMVWNTWPTKPEWTALAEPLMTSFHVIGGG